MKRVPITQPAPLANDRVTEFVGERNYLATGSVNDDGLFTPELVTYSSRPTRADLLAKPGDVCFARMQGTRKIFEVRGDSGDPILSTGFAVFRPDLELVDTEFLRCWVASEEFQSAKDRLCTGATQKAITNAKINTLLLPLPPLAEQKRIAGILDATDALRAKSRESLAQLDTLLQSTFLTLFGDPVTNPMGWERCEFGDHIEVLTDYHANGSYKVLKEHVEIKNSEDFALMVRTTDLENESFDTDNIYVSQDAYTFLEKSKVYGGEIIINKIGSAGNVYLMPFLNRPVSLGMNAFLLRMKTSVNSLFAYYFLTSKFGENEIKKRVKGAVTKTIRKDAVRAIPFLLPSTEAQESFAAIVVSVEKQKTRQREHLAEMDALFASLQSRAFNGDL